MMPLTLALLFFAAPAVAQDKPAEKGTPAEPQITVQGAKTEEQTKARLRADSLLARCIIKPVMTDEEKAVCADAYRVSQEVAEAEKRQAGKQK
jgi:hypothetical protein